MADPGGRGQQERFAEVMAALAEEPGVSFGKPGKAFGSSALKVNDKIFAMISSAGQFVVKLPKVRVDGLTVTAAGIRFEAGKGRPMKEWLAVYSESTEEWVQLAREALSFVRSLP